MKKVILTAVCFLMPLLFWGCKAEEQNHTDATGKTVTFVNGGTDADVWILPQTEQNLKTTVWGTATLSKVKGGENRQAVLCEPGDGGLYIFRMIDAEGFFYSANGLALEAGWTLQISGDELSSLSLEIRDGAGAVKDTYDLFAARL